jgi:hypothetical protein
VDVDCQWRALQPFDGSEIDRYGGAGDFLKEPAAEGELIRALSSWFDRKLAAADSVFS